MDSNISSYYGAKYNTYVGARYVPKIVGEWDSNTKYEPLTVVLYQGNSYTSKTFVPKGIVPTNAQYWSMTGNYNVQVDLYRQETAEVKNEVTKRVIKTLNVQEMKDFNAKVGDVIETTGYYVPNDGGNATYIVKEITDAYSEVLNNGLFAELIEDTINVLQRGCKRNDINFDNSPIFNSIFNNFGEKVTVFIPSGTYLAVSPVYVYSSVQNAICTIIGENFTQVPDGNHGTIIDYNGSDYLFNLNYDSTLNFFNPYFRCDVSNIGIVGNTLNSGYRMGKGRYNFDCLSFAYVVRGIYGEQYDASHAQTYVDNSTFKNIYFRHLSETGILVNYGDNTLFSELSLEYPDPGFTNLIYVRTGYGVTVNNVLIANGNKLSNSETGSILSFAASTGVINGILGEYTFCAKNLINLSTSNFSIGGVGLRYSINTILNLYLSSATLGELQFSSITTTLPNVVANDVCSLVYNGKDKITISGTKLYYKDNISYLRCKYEGDKYNIYNAFNELVDTYGTFDIVTYDSGSTYELRFSNPTIGINPISYKVPMVALNSTLSTNRAVMHKSAANPNLFTLWLYKEDGSRFSQNDYKTEGLEISFYM